MLVPFYREEYDTIAQRIYEEALPGYNIDITVPTRTPLKDETPLLTRPQGCRPSNNSRIITLSKGIFNPLKD